jgi:putative serine protease PepD
MTAATLLTVERATVKLEIVDSNGDSTGWGSGTIIGRHGLILTNSHVAAPNALGMDTQYGAPLGDATPAYLLVETRGPGPDGDVHPVYRAHTVIADGYLDLALVQVYARANGQPISPTAVHLPTLAIGNSDAVHVGDDVTVVGFPGVSESRAATVTKGDASAFVHDQRLHSDRAWIETSARIAHGNSGGAAVNDAGQLIGVPTRIAPPDERDVGWWFRPVNWAKPLITRVRARRTLGYVTPYVTAASGVTITPLGWSATQASACSSPAVGPVGAHAPSGTGQLYLAVTVSGLASGLQLNAQVNGPAGYLDVVPGTSNGAATSCFTIPIMFGNGDGLYNVALSVDPPGTATRTADISVGVQ